MFRKIITAGPISLGAAIVVADSKNKKDFSVPPSKAVDELAHYKCKPSELPIYAPLHSINKPKEKPHPEAEPGAIEGAIRTARVEVTSVLNIFSEQKRNVTDFINTGKAHTQGVFEYLHDPSNTIQRGGAIAAGGLIGLLFGIRRGFFKRVIYTTTGAGVVASICYPKEAGIYVHQGIAEAKKGASITYNFIFGVKPGDDVNAPNFPKIPTTMSEVTDSVSDLVKSAKDTLFPSKK